MKWLVTETILELDIDLVEERIYEFFIIAIKIMIVFQI